jgi:hypothetical protein
VHEWPFFERVVVRQRAISDGLGGLETSFYEGFTTQRKKWTERAPKRWPRFELNGRSTSIAAGTRRRLALATSARAPASGDIVSGRQVTINDKLGGLI